MTRGRKHSFHNGLEQKYCNTCSKWKNLDLFSFCNNNWDKLKTQCIDCRYNYCKQRRASFTVEQREKHLIQARKDSKDYRLRGGQRLRRKARREQEPKYAMLCRLRKRLVHVLKSKGIKKTNTTMELCGCSLDELKVWLEKQFVENMSWDNRSEWHIDHIRPCASFDLTDIKQQKQCFHFSNLQPLWAHENLKKSDKWSP